MPRKDPAEKRAYQKEWLSKRISEGYGKRLYARRKLHRENSILFREALEAVVRIQKLKDIPSEKRLAEAATVARKALRAADREEEALKGVSKL